MLEPQLGARRARSGGGPSDTVSLPAYTVLVACMLEGFTPSRLALFVRLSLAGFRIPEPAHLQGRLLAAGQAVVLVLLFLGGLHVDAALRLPVGPDVG